LTDLCFLLVFKDTLFKQIVLSLLGEMDSDIQFLESSADDIDSLLNEISEFRPNTVLFEEASPLWSASCLIHLLKEMPGCPIVVISQEHNLVHVVHWQTLEVEKADDLFKSIKSV
jgi:hypothetical protein